MKKIIVTLVALISGAMTFAQDISLNGEWNFRVQGKEYVVNVPHTFNLMDGLEDYAGEAVYSRALPVTAVMKGRTVRICFEAVYHDAAVYVNGVKAGEHLGKGYTPFSLDITGLLRYDGSDAVEVRVSNAYTEHALPYKRSFDWCNDGGIIRGVRLHLSGKQTLRYVHVTPCVNLVDSTGSARFDVRLYDEKAGKLNGRLRVIDRRSGEVVYDAAVALTKKRGEREFRFNADFGRVNLWHFDTPNLYDFTFEIEGSDSLSDHFGFCSFKVEGRSFVLNGEVVRLPGIEDMPGSHPSCGMAETPEVIAQTVAVMKDLNATITRFHWPQDRRMLDLMDETGILVTEQIPWWQQPAPALGEELRQNAREQLEEMIEADYNHPCIYAWGLANEVWGNEDDLKYLDGVSKTLDPSRPTLAFSHETYINLDKNPSCVLDIPTWNEYTGAWHGPVREDLPGRLERIDSALVDRPLFITEAGLCEPAFTGGDGRRIDDMIYHVKEWQKAPFIPGYIYFCVQDYRTQMGEEGYGKWRIRRHGVTKCDFTPKASYQVLRQLMCPVEIVEVLPANSRSSGDSLAGQVIVDESDHDVRIGLKVKDSIPSYILRGYKVEYMDGNGVPCTYDLPDLAPGELHTFVLRCINRTYTFKVVRPGGQSVIEY